MNPSAGLTSATSASADDPALSSVSHPRVVVRQQTRSRSIAASTTSTSAPVVAVMEAEDTLPQLTVDPTSNDHTTPFTMEDRIIAALSAVMHRSIDDKFRTFAELESIIMSENVLKL